MEVYDRYEPLVKNKIGTDNLLALLARAGISHFCPIRASVEREAWLVVACFKLVAAPFVPKNALMITH